MENADKNIDINANKERFLSIIRENVKRDGIEEFLKWLEQTDFFYAPASSKYHLNIKGGLCQHSLNVYDVLIDKHADKTDNPESLAIAALFHDVCKANFYKIAMRNQKNERTLQWEKVPYYQIEDQFPYGHGEKSVYLIERFMRLKVNEAVAIRWHMGGFDDAVKGGSFALSQSFERYPLAVKLHLSDLEATYLLESN